MSRQARDRCHSAATIADARAVLSDTHELPHLTGDHSSGFSDVVPLLSR
ncbi:MAG: hypothetical protein ACXU9O_11755 [Gemmatimonadaceae bacterium]